MINPKNGSKHSTYMKQMDCPICGYRGSLKMRETRLGYKYYQVDHYVCVNSKKTYHRCCTIPKSEEKVIVP